MLFLNLEGGFFSGYISYITLFVPGVAALAVSELSKTVYTIKYMVDSVWYMACIIYSRWYMISQSQYHNCFLYYAAVPELTLKPL